MADASVYDEIVARLQEFPCDGSLLMGGINKIAELTQQPAVFNEQEIAAVAASETPGKTFAGLLRQKIGERPVILVLVAFGARNREFDRLADYLEEFLVRIVETDPAVNGVSLENRKAILERFPIMLQRFDSPKLADYKARLDAAQAKWGPN